MIKKAIKVVVNCILCLIMIFFLPLIVMGKENINDHRAIGIHKSVKVIIKFTLDQEDRVSGTLIKLGECAISENTSYPRSGWIHITNIEKFAVNEIKQEIKDSKDKMLFRGYIIDYKVTGEDDTPLYMFIGNVIRVKNCNTK